LKKGWPITHEKWHFLLNMHFLIDEITNLFSNFTWRKQCFLPIDWYQWRRVWVYPLPTFGPLESVTVLRLNVAFKEAYNAGILYF
jgi:hypothetical protein